MALSRPISSRAETTRATRNFFARARRGVSRSIQLDFQREARGALREGVRADLPIAADGSISLIARAWAVRGKC